MKVRLARSARRYGFLFSALLLTGCAAPTADVASIVPGTGTVLVTKVKARNVPGPVAVTQFAGLQGGLQSLMPLANADREISHFQFDTADEADAASDGIDGGKLLAASPIAANAPNVSKFTQAGRASYYANSFHGRRTASGERYDMNALTAAHPSLPLDSYVRVTNAATQKSVIVRINDRGPFHVGRIIDLSLAAARALGFKSAGTGVVKIQGLSVKQARTERAEMLAAETGK
jgi:rare lipoprotein A